MLLASSLVIEDTNMGELVLTAFHGLYELIRLLWWVFFLGWWAFWGLKAYRAKSWVPLQAPALFTAVGLVIALMTTSGVYDAVNRPGEFTVQLDPCSSWDDPGEQSDCYADDARAAEHFESLAVFTDDRKIHFLKTYWSVFGDTVSYVQIVLLWLLFPYLFFRPKKHGPKKVERDIIRV